MKFSGKQLFEANQQWMSRPADQRYTTLAELKEAVEARRNISKAANVQINRLEAKVQDGSLLINSEVEPSIPSHWGFGQLSRMVGAPADYLRKLPLDLTVQNLNHGLQSAPKDQFKIMTLRNEDGGHDALQAVTSTTYGRIWDADVVNAADKIVQRTDGRFFNPKDWSGKPSGLYASDRDVFMFMIDGGSMVDGGNQRDQLHRGFFMWNSEVGASSFGLMTFLFRVACGNHIVWDAQDVNKLVIRHTTGGPARFISEATPALLEYANASVKPIEEAIGRAKKILLPKKEDEVVAEYAKKGFTRGELKDAVKFAKAEEGKCENLWELVQGFTASARSIEWMDSRIDLEKRAGNLLKVVNA